ncbi:hypothetical protein [Candidatus Parabeggiatoa sp. HSG14]|uniref:hypothetical protein n=1 Tax=Candidatus Parabeggiatoa sp. HSG14 TaxID=3055593 RepID=UPI0025A6AE9A|nr:hypothetical protein [Thiotrichales bacterium HSG14]
MNNLFLFTVIVIFSIFVLMWVFNIQTQNKVIFCIFFLINMLVVEFITAQSCEINQHQKLENLQEIQPLEKLNHYQGKKKKKKKPEKDKPDNYLQVEIMEIMRKN